LTTERLDCGRSSGDRGIAVVQSPEDAEFEQMPETAIANVRVDYQVSAANMAALLLALIRENPMQPTTNVESVMPERTQLTCPDCHGPIQRFHFGNITEYKCRVGHTYSPESMVSAHEDYEERALWSAIESLEEGADLIAETNGNRPAGNASFKGNMEAKRNLAKTIRNAIEKKNLPPGN
jgi:two-component system, chemotaxis family, protein-glutamate methylesterase/glutaminase